MKKKKIDRWEYGALLAIILPIIGFFVFWQWKHGERNWEQLWNYMTISSANRNNILIFPLVPNLILFYFSNFLYRWDRFTVGLVGVTILLAVPVVISLVW